MFDLKAKHTLWALLKRDLELETPHFVSRLDRETSGIVLIAKDKASAKACRRQAERRTLHKEYLLLATGTMTGAIHARGWMVPDDRSAVRKKRRFLPMEGPPSFFAAAESAETWFEPLRQCPGMTLVRAVLGSGRTHQIRATLTACGFPLVGDKLYGPDDTLFLRFVDGALTAADRRLLRLPRQALHASRLIFQHPRTNREIVLEAPLPGDMQALLCPPFGPAPPA